MSNPVSSLVTGASGFLGGRLVQMLLEQGEAVTVLARAGSDLRHLPIANFVGDPTHDGGAVMHGARIVPTLSKSVRIVRGDLGDKAALAEAVAGATRVFHCAACSTDWATDEAYFAANVTGTRNLVDAAQTSWLRTGCLERFVQVSTTDIYGYPLVPGGEEQPIVDAGLPYNRTKGMGEAIVWEASAAGMPVTIVRPATIYGPRGKDFTQEIATMLRQRMMATIDGGRARGGFVYVDTVAQAMMDASVSAATLGQAYNIADGEGVTWAEYLRVFARQLGTPTPWLDLSFGVATGMAKGFEAVHRALRLGGRPLLTRHAVILLGRDQEFPVEKAQRDFGFEAKVGVEEGVKRSVDWLRGGAAR